jgi:hypothetical protein
MSCLVYENLPEVIDLGGGLTISKADAVKVAGHILTAQCLVTGAGADFIHLDLALYRLIDMFGGDYEAFGGIADELLTAAIEMGEAKYEHH